MIQDSRFKIEDSICICMTGTLWFPSFPSAVIFFPPSTLFSFIAIASVIPVLSLIIRFPRESKGVGLIFDLLILVVHFSWSLFPFLFAVRSVAQSAVSSKIPRLISLAVWFFALHYRGLVAYV